jgi:putative Mn2+ efflux pump MntP
MITLFALIMLGVGGCYLVYHYTNNFETIGFVMLTIFGLWALVHGCLLLSTTREYDTFTVKRESFEKTLSTSRKLGNKLETASIVRDLAEWNTDLAMYKFDNLHWYLGQFTDDRFNELKPIK